VKEWFLGLSARERMLVAAAAGLTALALIVLLIVRPLFGSAARAQARVVNKQELLAELDQVAARIGPQSTANAGGAQNGGQSLVVVVDRTTRSRGLSTFLRRNQPDGEQSIRLRFENAPFDQLIEWLGTLQAGHGLTATNATFDSAEEPGRINCTLVLARAGG
jgi:general secretion pathway protein M